MPSLIEKATLPREVLYTNRKMADIVEDKKFLVLPEHQTVQEACRCMWEWRIGAVLVLNNQQRLAGILYRTRRGPSFPSLRPRSSRRPRCSAISKAEFHLISGPLDWIAQQRQRIGNWLPCLPA